MTKISDTPTPESADESADASADEPTEAAPTDEVVSAPIQITKQTKRMMNAAMSIELEELDTIGYTSHFMAQASLPLTEPDAPYYTRKNGNMRMTITPTPIDIDGDGVMTMTYPYGVYPRLALIWIISEAVRTGYPRVSLGRTINDFMTTLGLEGGGGTRVKEVRRQLLALFQCTLSLTSTDEIDGLTRDRLLNLTIASEAVMWTDTTRRTRPKNVIPMKPNGFNESWVELSPAFFAKLTKDGAVPLDSRAVHALSGNAFALDIYTWATWRVHVAKGREVQIPWTTLSKQFGADYKLTRQFKAAFLRNLTTRVKLVFPTLEYSSTTTHFILHGGTPAVPGRIDRKL